MQGESRGCRAGGGGERPADRTEPDRRRRSGKARYALAEASVLRTVLCEDSVDAGVALDTG